jgi:hypothetical protein
LRRNKHNDSGDACSLAIGRGDIGDNRLASAFVLKIEGGGKGADEYIKDVLINI